MEFRVLGPLEIADGDRAILLDAPKQRALLGVLLLHPNEVVSSERLIDELWGERPPATAAKLVQTYISQLRKSLGPELIATRPPGYMLLIQEQALDTARFRRLTIVAGRLVASGEHARASACYREALALWRGPPFADVLFQSFARNEVERMEEERLAALMDQVDCELALGHHDQLIPELHMLVGQYPLAERLHGELMLALYRSGRQAEALAAYQAARRILVEQLGLEPSAELRRLEKSMLSHDSALGPRSAPIGLPLPTTPLVGREREIDYLRLALGRERARLVTVTGPGGVGKTRLALEAAHDVADAFVDGVFLVDFAPVRDSELVLPTIATAIGAPRGLVDHVSDSRMLFILDTFEQLVPGGPALARFLGVCPNVALLVTSRERLRLTGEREYPLAPLEDAPAVELFRQRAKAARPDFEADDEVLVDISRRLDRLPLAIELAAARAKVFTPRELRKRLEQRLPLLKDGPRDVPERQRTLEATIEWSHDLLDAKQRTAFRRLSVFAGGCTFEAAERVCNADFETAASLIDKSLVEQRGGRLAMLDTIREFAGERLRESGEANETRRKHAEHYLRLAEAVHGTEREQPKRYRPDWGRAVTPRGDPYGVIEGEEANVRLAIAWGLQRDRKRFPALWRLLPPNL
jgi:predicted ATPase/DNA-binding SARP family transcriptional activator